MEGKQYPLLPIIDLSSFVPDGSREEQEKVARQLHKACSEFGFFYIRGHGCKKSTVDDTFNQMKDFFDSPYQKKNSLAAKNSALYRGYNGIDSGSHCCTPREKGNPRDRKESFTIGAEKKTGKNGGKFSSSPMHGDNQWVDFLPAFEPAMRSYWDSLLNTVSPRLTKALAMSLNIEDTFFSSQCDNPVAQMVLLRYPGATDPSRHRGCGAHTDCGFLTILAQEEPEVDENDNDCNSGALEVQRRKDGTWISVPHIPDTFIVNLGNMAAYWTNDIYKSTPHRVQVKKSTRHSIPFFLNCNFDTNVECLPNCGTPKYPKTRAGEYILKKLGLMYLMEQDNPEQ